jgi:predicted acyltransferase
VKGRVQEGFLTPESYHLSTVSGLLITGFIFMAAGLAWNFSFPINKNLWTSSYVLFAGGLSLVLLAVCYWLLDRHHFDRRQPGKALVWPWLVFGSNAITAYVLSNFIVELMIWIKVPDSFTGKSISTWAWTYWHVFARRGSTNVTSLVFAVCFVALCFVPNWVLWRKKIFLKV